MQILTYRWQISLWIYSGNTGATGSAGVKGARGVVGDTGASGATGVQLIKRRVVRQAAGCPGRRFKILLDYCHMFVIVTRRLYCVEWTQYSIRPKRSATCNRSFPRPTRGLNANSISIASEFSAGHTRWQTDRQTDRPRYSVVHNRRHLSTY